MPMMNRMTDLLNKLEHRLGADVMGLPKEFQKDYWARKVIAKETLDTFSRFFPHKMKYVLGPENKKNDYYLIDESICEQVDILGAGDIDWHKWSTHFPGLLYGGVNSYDMMTSGIDYEGMVDVQMMADHVSLFSNGIYVDFEPPNRIYLRIVIASSFLTNFQRIPIHLFVKHPLNLKTIEPTKMETFEELALADVATYLYEKLKMYDQMETAFTNVDLKLASLEEKARSRADIVEKLRNSYVSAANKAMPIMITVN